MSHAEARAAVDAREAASDEEKAAAAASDDLTILHTLDCGCKRKFCACRRDHKPGARCESRAARF